nr:flagellin lysine-N-methylase [uncultured Cellulosilyticum sp.]
MKGKVIGPGQIKDFKCIGAACEDTCCAGWYIGIDEATFKKYKKVKDPVMKKRFDKELVAKGASVEHAAKIKLKNNRCAFLSKEGWCDIFTQLGESYLSETCTLFPRTFNEVGEHVEYSIALSCPEAARMILLNEAGFKLEGVEAPNHYKVSGKLPINEKKPQKWQDYLLEIRSILMGLIQNRNKCFFERFSDVEDFLLKLDSVSRKQSVKEIQNLLVAYKDLDKLPASLNHPFKDKWKNKALALVMKLKVLRCEKKWPSTFYENSYNDLLEGLNLVEKDDLRAAKVCLEKGEKNYLEPFMKTHGYILENYFANYIFERLVPLDGENVLESLTKLEIYKHLIFTHLIAMGNVKEKIDAHEVVAFIQAFSKVFDHNEIYMYKLLKLEKASKQ